MTVATKFGIQREADACARGPSDDPAPVRAACEASLRGLDTDRIDLLHIHRAAPGRPIEEPMRVPSRLVAEMRQGGVRGRPRHLAARAVQPISAPQSEDALGAREPEGAVLAADLDWLVRPLARAASGRSDEAHRSLSVITASPGSAGQNAMRARSARHARSGRGPAFADVVDRPTGDLWTCGMPAVAAPTAMGTAPRQPDHARAVLDVGRTREEVALQMVLHAGVTSCTNGVSAVKLAFAAQPEGHPIGRGCGSSRRGSPGEAIRVQTARRGDRQRGAGCGPEREPRAERRRADQRTSAAAKRKS